MPTLYFFVGFPGSGKTTVANYICEAAGADHIWADRERQAMFGEPSHSQKESDELYDILNRQTKKSLETGQSVVFDTNFNYRKDRDYMRQIAQEAGAEIAIVQMTTPIETARLRALHGDHAERNGMAEAMTPETFQRIVDHLEPLGNDEPHVEIDGTDVGRAAVLTLFSL